MTSEMTQCAWPREHDALEIMTVETVEVPEKRGYDAVKRLFDRIAALLGLIVLFVPMLLIGLYVRLELHSSAIYRQERLGKNGEPFVMYKFRTMHDDAEADGARWAEANDARCTKTGAALRRSHLDELPQLWNILRGDMSFVGPRPERACFYELFEQNIKGFSQRMLVMPGLTGLAQINGGYRLGPREKIVYDVRYIKERSIGMDVRCLLGTFGKVFGDEAAR